MQVKCVRCTFVKFLSDSSCCLCSTIPARKISITFQHCCCCKKIIFEFQIKHSSISNKYMNKNRSNNKYSDDNILSLLPCKVAMHSIRMFRCFVSNFGWFAHLTSHCIFWWMQSCYVYICGNHKQFDSDMYQNRSGFLFFYRMKKWCLEGCRNSDQG